MRHTALIAALLLLIALTIALPWSLRRSAAVDDGQAGARITQVDTTAYPQVTLHMRVDDASGRSVGGLGAADFLVREDGSAVTIDSFAGAGETPITVALVVDRSGSMADDDKIAGAREAALAFVELLRPADRATVITFNSEPRTTAPLSGDTQELGAAIARIRPEGGTALYDSIVAGVDALRDVSGRRVLLLLTDGQDCIALDHCPDVYGSHASLADALAYAERHEQPIHVVGLGERGSDGIDEAVLRQIAATSGGDYSYAPDAAQLADLYRRIAGDAQREYTLSYQSPRPFNDGTRRDITIDVAGYAGGGGYLQPHLIDVRSDPLVGLLLIVPIGALLLVPVWRTRGNAPPPALQHASPCAMESVGTIPLPASYCIECGHKIRTGARFCARCGAPIRSITVELEAQR
jgi:VWFA-related protein